MNTKLPSFMSSRKEPIVDAAPPALASPSDPIAKANELGNVVAALIAERNHLSETVDFQRQHIESLQARLAVAEQDVANLTSKAEFYERFSMEITTQFNTIRMIVDDTQRRAERVARKQEAPTPAAPPPSGDPLAELEAAITLQKEPTP